MKMTKIINQRFLCICCLLAVICGMVMFNSENNTENNSVEDVINTAISFQYGWRTTNSFTRLCTDEFAGNTNMDDLKLGLRYYHIENDYMKSVQELNENEIVVRVNVYSPDLIVHVFTLKKVGDNAYLVSRIEHDI